MVALGPFELGPNKSLTNGIYWGDFFKQVHHIPHKSVKLMLCDPVYNRPSDYWRLARMATYLLAEGGNVIAQTGHIYRFENEHAMVDGGEGLDHRPLLTEVFTGGFGTLWMHRALRSSTPYIWLSKGSIKDRGFPKTAFFGSKDKELHAWADGTRSFIYLIETFTKEGDIVLDPFTGSGTVAAACIMTNRRYLCFEIDPDTLRIARKRVSQTQPPLFVPQYSQLAMVGA
jgi:hypothetical protein